MSSDNREAFRQTVEDWLNDERWPEPYDLSHAIVASDWFKAARAEGAAEVTERVKAVLAELLADREAALRSRYDTPAHHARWKAAEAVRAALGAGEDLPQGERERADTKRPCTICGKPTKVYGSGQRWHLDADYDELHAPPEHSAVTGQERGQDG